MKELRVGKNEISAVIEDKHYHCPCGCEHPQPIEHMGKHYCGLCWFKYQVVTEVVLCTPEVCS